MPLRVSNSVERNVNAIPFIPVVVPVNTSTPILPDVSTDMQEYSGRYIQNANSANICYIVFGQTTCDLTNYAVALQPYQQFDCSNFPQNVVAFSPGGCTICGYVVRRNDMQRGAGGNNIGGVTGGGIL